MSETCTVIHRWLNRLDRFSFPFDENKIPLNGVYVLFERGETGHDLDRIVRIGTHNGENQLRSRLQQHFIKENKDRSIFRKNIGRAILNRDKDPFLEKWELDLTPSEARERPLDSIDIEAQKKTERTVTRYIQDNFSFVVFGIDDKRERLELESKLISTVSLCEECGPSPSWLGLSSPKEKIRESGLWLVNELYKKPLSENDMADLQKLLFP